MPGRIVIIGAGSAMFTQGLVADLILDGREWELRLVDIDPLALDVARALAERMVGEKQAPITVLASLDRRDLLPEADVVVTTIAVGGRRAWETDVFVPRRFGIFQPVGDSVTVGGILRAMRMVPPMVAIAQDVVELCPNALFVNYSNPMSVICRAIHRATKANVIGLCHGVNHTHGYLASSIGLPQSQTSAIAVGVNHLTWFTEFRARGQDAWPLVRRALARATEECAADHIPGQVFAEAGTRPAEPGVRDNPFSWELFQAYGAFPAVLDRHVTEFFPAMLRERAYYGKTLGVDAFSLEAVTAHGDEVFGRMLARARRQEPIPEWLFRRQEGEHEQLLDILRALEGDRPVLFSMNLPNRGQVSNLPADAILESPAAVGAGAIRPLTLGPLLAGPAAILKRVIAVQELTVEAALSQDRGLLVQALVADGAVRSPSEADQLLAAVAHETSGRPWFARTKSWMVDAPERAAA